MCFQMHFFGYVVIAMICLSQLNGQQSDNNFCQTFADNSFEFPKNYPMISAFANRAELVVYFDRILWTIAANFTDQYIDVTNALTIDTPFPPYSHVLHVSYNNSHAYGFYNYTNQVMKWVSPTNGTLGTIGFGLGTHFESSVLFRYSSAMLCFLGQPVSANSSQQFDRRHICFDFKDIFNPLRVWINPWTNETESVSEVMAIIGPIGGSVVGKYVLLFKEGTDITYCRTQQKDFLKDCTNFSGNHLLISCKGYEKRSKPTKSNTLWYILAVILVIAVIIVSMSVCYYTLSKQSTEHKSESTQQLVKTSKESQMTQTLSKKF